MRSSSILVVFTVALIFSLVGMTGSTATLANPAATPAATTALQRADDALFNGDYTTARQLYDTAVNTAGSDARLKCDALYGSAVASLRAQALDVAERTFTRALQECKPTLRAYLLRGDARRLLKKNDLAVADYAAALKLQPGLVDSYVYERMASISGDQGLKYLRLASEAPRAPVTQLDLHKRLLQIYKALNATPEIIQQYTAILSLADQHDELADAEVGLADIELAANQTASAYERLQRVIQKYPETKPAFPALVTLVSNGQTVDLLVRTRINVLNENYLPVIARVTNFLNATPDSPAAPELYVLLGRALRGLNRYDEAFATFQKVQSLHPADPMASVADLERAETYVLQKDAANALTAYLDVATRYPKSPEAPEALWRGANAEQNAGHIDHAVSLFEQLGNAYPGTDQATRGLFQAGTLVMATDPARAMTLFGKMQNAQGLLWQGKMMQQLNLDPRPVWTAAEAKAPDGFFGLRARDLRYGSKPYQAPTSLDCCDLKEADRPAAEQWLRTVFKLPKVSADLAPELATNPFLLRGTALWQLGWWQEATDEFDALHSTVRTNALALYQLAIYYRNLRVYRSSLISATRLLNLSNLPHTAAPPYLGRLAYPLFYTDLLLPAAKANNLDPLYVASLIRTESNFNPSITSSADARGLMQITPATGQEVADQQKLNGFTTDDLFRPVVNIQLGTAYLNGIKQALNNNPTAALVAYNAGPTYAQALLQQSGDDLERFYQSVDVEETRQYIEYTYETYAMYKLLYGVEGF